MVQNNVIKVLISFRKLHFIQRICRPVVVVPILEPNVNGYILSRDITPTPANGVRAEVNIELL